MILATISISEAKALTDRIRVAADDLWRLIQQAHDQQAWRVMGYSSWKSYVQTEFGMSSRHSYRLLAQAKVIQALEEDSDPRVTPQLTERQARHLKPRLGEAREFVRQKIEDGVEPQEAVQQAVKTYGKAYEEAAVALARDPISVLAKVINAANDLRLAWPIEEIAPAIANIYGSRDVQKEIGRLRDTADYLNHICDVMESYLE